MRIETLRPDLVEGVTELWVEMIDHHAVREPIFTRAEDASATWAAYVAELIDDPAWLVLVALDGDEAIGYAIATVRENPPVFAHECYGFVQDIGVREARRRGGVATALFRAAERWLLDQGVARIELDVAITNASSTAFWRRLGFAPYLERQARDYPGE